MDLEIGVCYPIRYKENSKEVIAEITIKAKNKNSYRVVLYKNKSLIGIPSTLWINKDNTYYFKNIEYSKFHNRKENTIVEIIPKNKVESVELELKIQELEKLLIVNKKLKQSENSDINSEIEVLTKEINKLKDKLSMCEV